LKFIFRLKPTRSKPFKNDNLIGYRLEGVEETRPHGQCRQLDLHGRQE